LVLAERRLAGDDQVADLPDEACGYIVGTYDKDAGANNQRLCISTARVSRR
jgi:hypothetical protein